jgi:DNA primase
MSTTLFNLLQADGIDLKRVSACNGGEYAGPCPFCGGKDRFRVWPEMKGGRYWCRSCSRRGDAVQYLRDARGLGYKEACERLGVAMKSWDLHRPMHRKRVGFVPGDAASATPLWQLKATPFFQAAQQTLQSEVGRAARLFLAERGLTEDSIKCLGWNPAETYREREAWGLAPETRRDGKAKRLWLPGPGLVIPLWADQRVIRIRIRRSDPGDGPRYVIISGSSMPPMTWGLGMQVLTIVESELDGLLIWQEAGTLTGVVALGSVSTRPDRITHEALMRVGLILVSLDSDDAGARASWHFWRETYGAKAKRWPCAIGKDPADAWQTGLDISAWIWAGIEEGSPEA